MVRTKLSIALLLAAIATLVAAATAQAGPIGAWTTQGALSYVSAPTLHPPKLSTLSSAAGRKLAPGYFMIANFKDIGLSAKIDGQGGPLILDNQLRPVWFQPVPTSDYALNLRTQTFAGKPALSWWQGVLNNEGVVSSGEDVVVNQQYKTVARLKGADGWVLTPHEFLISGDNAWVTANEFVSGVNLTQFGGPANGVIIDSAVQEYSLKTGKLEYSWAAYGGGHIPLSEAATTGGATIATSPANAWDPYHINSINLVGNGEFLVSMRNTWGGYLVNASTSQIIWTLGTRANSSFSFGSGASFEWQHDMELHSGNQVSLFDDACCALGGSQFTKPFGSSRGLVLSLNTTAHTAAVVHQYVHSPALQTSTQGNTQVLPDGDAVVGWGAEPYLTEYTSSGKVLLDATMPGPDISYRAYVESWVGTPSYPPSGAGRETSGHTTIYASWNGATKVAKWRVLGGPSARQLKAVATVARGGFETPVKLAHNYRQYQVDALDSHGHVLGRSRSFGAVKGKTPPPVGGY
jgi:Arylsulfotransferase (ASST)